jgi:hypothetical protein
MSNETKFLISLSDRDDFDEETVAEVAVALPVVKEPPARISASPKLIENSASTEEPSDTGQSEEALKNDPPPMLEVSSETNSETDQQVDQPTKPSNLISQRQPFRQKFQRWPNQPPRWNPMAPQQQQIPFQRSSGPVMRQPAHMMQGGPGPQRQMRPGFPPQSRPYFNNNFMQSRPPIRQPMARQRFFYQNPPHMGDPSMQGSAPFIPTSIMGSGNPSSMGSLPRKVLINPNFKGGVEAAKSELNYFRKIKNVNDFIAF